MTALLLIEDDEPLRRSLTLTLRDEGFDVTAVASLTEGRAHFQAAAQGPELLLLDVRLGDGSGVELVRALAAARRLPPTVVVSGAATIAETVEALRLGVFDFIEKPLSKERLLQSLRNALEHRRLKQRVETLEQRLDGEQALLGSSPAMAALREQLARVAPTDARVLILGESGTGKELVAKQLHRQSRRQARPFLKLNCAAIPGALIEAELFGHARGAFTDARSARAGLFEEADGGTLLLDEIGDMDAQLQARLLRVLEDGSVRRLGESQERRVDVRVLAATHRDLEHACSEGAFRRDLFFRLAHVPLAVPALRERGEDVALLFRHFVEAFSAQHGLRPKHVTGELCEALLAYAWPGNVRELRNLAERLVVMGTDPLTPEQLPADLLRCGPVDEVGWLRPARLGAGRTTPYRRFKAECEREYLEAVLQRCGWNYAAAARALGLQRTYLHSKALALGISRPELGGREE